jgi:dipeptidyl aminopeptidase/acylaminoacyl peptidase
VVWPAIAARAGRIAFERDFGHLDLDTATGKGGGGPHHTPRRGGAARGRALVTDLAVLRPRLVSGRQEGRFRRAGDVYAASAKTGGDADRVTSTDGPESDLVWSSDSNRLIYASERDGASRLYLYDYIKKTERPLTAGPVDSVPRVSPSGKEIAFTRDGREIRVVDVASGRERPGGHRHPSTDPPSSAGATSPGLQMGSTVAYFAVGERLFSNVWIAPAAGGGEARPASFLANVGSNAIAWSPDGAYLLFTTSQRSENGQLARVDLLPRVPHFREDQFRDLFREGDAPGPGAVQARTRCLAGGVALPVAVARGHGQAGQSQSRSCSKGSASARRLLPVGVDAGDQVISPDGKWVVLIATAAGQSNLWAYPLDELRKEEPVARQLTSTPGDKSDPAFSPDSKEVFYLDQGHIQVVPLDGKPRALAVTAERDTDFDAEKTAVFTQAWTYLRDNFHDAAHHGTDWAAVRAAYAPRWRPRGRRTSCGAP